MSQNQNYRLVPLSVVEKGSKKTFRTILVLIIGIILIFLLFYITKFLLNSNHKSNANSSKNAISTSNSIFSQIVNETSQASSAVKRRSKGPEGTRYVKEKLELVEINSKGNTVVLSVQGLVGAVNGNSITLTDYTDEYTRIMLITKNTPVSLWLNDSSSVEIITDLSKIKVDDIALFTLDLATGITKFVSFIRKD